MQHLGVPLSTGGALLAELPCHNGRAFLEDGDVLGDAVCVLLHLDRRPLYPIRAVRDIVFLSQR